MKKILGLLLFLGLTGASFAQDLSPGPGFSPVTSQKFRVYRNTSAQALTQGLATTIQFNAVDTDPSGICNTTTTFVCTPTVPGTWVFFCQVDVLSTTGPAVGNNALADAQIVINGTAVSEQYIPTTVAALVTPRAFASTSTIVSMVASDTVGCKSINDSTSPTALNGQILTYMYGYKVGP